MKFKDVTHSKKIIYNVNIFDFMLSNIKSTSSIIYFSNKINSDIKKLSIYENNIIFVSTTDIPLNNLSITHLNNKILKHCSNEVIIAIDIDDNVSFKYMKYLINSLIKLFKIIKKYKFNFNYNNSIILAILGCDNSNPYFEDVYTTFKALLSNSKREQYEIVYDYICSYLDAEFTSKNLCGFCNDICDASRAGFTQHKLNGCCYTIEYSMGGVMLNHTPCKYLLNKNCTANCISCKLHTCYYLKTKNIKFKIKDILLLNCFFSYKQYFVLKYNVFKTKEEIIKKLLHVKFIPSIFYYPFSLYKIN